MRAAKLKRPSKTPWVLNRPIVAGGGRVGGIEGVGSMGGWGGGRESDDTTSIKTLKLEVASQ